MEVSQEQDHSIIKFNWLNTIKKYCSDNYPYESGGLILSDNSIIFCESVQKDMFNYSPNDIFYLNIIKPNNIRYSFHSHFHDPTPSENDYYFIKIYSIPLIIYSLSLNVFLSVNIKNEKIITSRFVEEAGMWKFAS